MQKEKQDEKGKGNSIFIVAIEFKIYFKPKL